MTSPSTRASASPPALTPMFSDAAGRAMWDEVDARVRERPYFRSEGLNARFMMPAWAAPWLVERSRQIVGAFHRFYRAVIDADRGPLADEPARQIEEPYARTTRSEGARDPILLGR